MVLSSAQDPINFDADPDPDDICKGKQKNYGKQSWYFTNIHFLYTIHSDWLTFDISNLDYLILQNSYINIKLMGFKDKEKIKIRVGYKILFLSQIHNLRNYLIFGITFVRLYY